ncbi:ferrous iron transport protein B [Tenacibaculum sp. 190524A02b]|uniref:ferrous iron transport protein B n=1 Tax=Tenacibaculum vairaonense TaxID=3137860 RepID=UPI0031FA9D0B
MSKKINVALIGNPNTGKTSLFNQLTGLNQKVGNYPGVTVDKKQGKCKLFDDKIASVVDLPGTYSINPTSLDESMVIRSVVATEDLPDVIIIVAEVENLKRNLLLFTQVQDLGLPTILAVNMSDQMERKGIRIDVEKLSAKLNTEVVLISARAGKGIDELKKQIADYSKIEVTKDFNSITSKIDNSYFESLKTVTDRYSLYKTWLMLTQNQVSLLTKEEKEKLSTFKKDVSTLKKYQHKETIYRYQYINEVLKETYIVDKTKATDVRSKLDKIFTHKVFGYVIFFGLLLLMFQSIFEWASAPMDFIDGTFANISEYVKTILPEGKLTDLLTDGVIPGIGGVVIFIPQIAILFLFIAILEETGYMSRVVFLMDKIMRRFGMSGKSVIPLISGTACAIPAVMATRTITSWKERLITILVTPFTTCSARLPVYAILIALIIPDRKLFGFLSLQGVTLLSLYLLGFIAAVGSAYVLHKMLKIKSTSFFVVEMPNYKVPSVKNVGLEVLEKTKAFILSAGQIILAISIVLWFLASHGPTSYNNVEKELTEATTNLTGTELDQKIASVKLEKSYIGIMGKTIEPIVTPLGYDWKIGIGLIASFAAREVFVGTLATIYSVENNDEDTTTIKQKMTSEVNAVTGGKRFNFPTGVSLLLFYAFAMQCMATLAIVKRETKSWKWPMIQLVGMGLLAYVSALLSYQILS